MNYKMLVRALGEFEVYQFMDSIEEFTEFYTANQENFNIFEIADLSEVEITEVNDNFSVYDMTLEHSGDHFWLLKDEVSGMYEPIDTQEQLDTILYHINKENNTSGDDLHDHSHGAESDEESKPKNS